MLDEKQNNSNELYHYGRLHMKWGQHIFSDIKKTALKYRKRKQKEKNIKENTKLQIKKLEKLAKEEARKRKFQKQQDKRIEEAKKRISDKYGIDYGKDNIPNKEKLSTKSNQSSTKSNQLTKKQINNLSDTELRDRQNRLQNEKNLIELQNYHATIGQKFVKSLMKDVVVPGATNAGRDLVTSFIKKYGEMGLEAFDTNLNKKKKRK